VRQVYRVWSGTALGERVAPAAFARPVALVLGNEETGLDPATVAACDEVMTIPGSGRVQSLNVAATAAILIYSLTRS
jgi:TrmH RNA methyltransferase